MGWTSGSSIGNEIWDGIRELIPQDNREEAARIIIDALEREDCDTINECEQLVKDAGLEDEYLNDEDDE